MADADRFDGFEIDRYEATLQGWFEVQPDDVSLNMQADRTVVMLVMARSHREAKDIKANADVVWQRMLKVQDAVVLSGPMREQALGFLESRSDQMSFDWDPQAASSPAAPDTGEVPVSNGFVQETRVFDSETGEILGQDTGEVEEISPPYKSTKVERAGQRSSDGPEDFGSVYPSARKDEALKRFLEDSGGS